MGFSAGWLALREPADRAARDTALARCACATQPDLPVVVDLGAGTGATRRAFADFLPAARWVLVDNDQVLLDMTAGEGDARITTVVRDLNDLDALPLSEATLVTASALLDLVSHDWLAALVARLRPQRLPFHAALTYDGRMAWSPPAAGDRSVVAAFNGHQRRDKGFGPALGPDAARVAARLFAEAGFRVRVADSPWRLDAGQADLQRDLLRGIAAAAGAAGTTAAAPWLEERLSLLAHATCRVGHVDLLALPPEECDTGAACTIIDEGPAGRAEGADDA